MIEILVSILILTGALFTFIGSLGLVRLPDFYSRLHAPTKATTLGVGSLLMASALWFSAEGAAWSLHEMLIVLFLFITAPISAHLLVKAALHLRLKGRPFLLDDNSQCNGDGLDHKSGQRRSVCTADPKIRPRSVGSAVRTNDLVACAMTGIMTKARDVQNWKG